MNVLGIIYFEGSIHPAACLLKDGKLILFMEEERLARAKQAKSYFPLKSISHCLKDGKIRINDYVKFRENWRPFAVSILEEHIEDYLEEPVITPFMMMAFDVVEEKAKDIQSAIHQGDSTTHPQSVSKKTNPIYWELINEFKKLTGVPAVLNTSFNIKGEPIVCSLSDALRCFYGTGIDVLIIGNFVVEKQEYFI